MKYTSIKLLLKFNEVEHSLQLEILTILLIVSIDMEKLFAKNYKFPPIRREN